MDLGPLASVTNLRRCRTIQSKYLSSGREAWACPILTDSAGMTTGSRDHGALRPIRRKTHLRLLPHPEEGTDFGPQTRSH